MKSKYSKISRSVIILSSNKSVILFLKKKSKKLLFKYKFFFLRSLKKSSNRALFYNTSVFFKIYFFQFLIVNYLSNSFLVVPHKKFEMLNYLNNIQFTDYNLNFKTKYLLSIFLKKYFFNFLKKFNFIFLKRISYIFLKNFFSVFKNKFLVYFYYHFFETTLPKNKLTQYDELSNLLKSNDFPMYWGERGNLPVMFNFNFQSYRNFLLKNLGPMSFFFKFFKNNFFINNFKKSIFLSAHLKLLQNECTEPKEFKYDACTRQNMIFTHDLKKLIYLLLLFYNL